MAIERWPAAWRGTIPSGLDLPQHPPPRGERHVAESFSAEWLAYDYDDTLWTASKEDRMRAFEGECG
jgi:hypothetical protein